jgi:hypothetical protein
MPELPRYADVHSHHIEGWADGHGDLGEIPLVSHIEGNLWMGGCIDGVPLPDDFGYVVSLYPWERYVLAPTTERFEFHLYDAGVVPDLRILHTAARQVLDATAQGPTLVHCQAGLNRSGLVAGLALVLDGRDADEVITLLRRRRSPAVLCNQVFEAWLRAVDPDELPPPAAIPDDAGR